MNNGNSSDNKFIAKRDGLTFDSPKVLTLLEDFKRQYIHRHIAQRIILYRPFTCWLNTQGNHYLPLPHDTQDEKVAIERKKSGGKGKSRKRNDNGGRRPWKNKPNKKQRKQ